MFHATEKDYDKIFIMTLVILILILYLLSDTGTILSRDAQKTALGC